MHYLLTHDTQMMINKCCELAGESIPGCVLQLFVFLSKPSEAGTFALVSIGISAMTTGFTSAMIAFDLDVDVKRRKTQPKFYGYIPDDYVLRGRCFVLMMLISGLHNLSRSIGVALLAVSGGGRLVMAFVGGGVGAYFLFKMARGDYFYWIRMKGLVKVIGSTCARFVAKVVADYSGCLHLRHPFEMGGVSFIVSMVWAQAMPFVALSMFDEGTQERLKGKVTTALVGSFGMWFLLNVAFFLSINLDYLTTFFATKTGSQYACEYYLDATDDASRWDAFATNSVDYTENIHPQVKEWIANNIGRWRLEGPEWFNVEMIPDEFLPVEVYVAEGGARRRRSSVSLRGMVGLDYNKLSTVKISKRGRSAVVHPEQLQGDE